MCSEYCAPSAHIWAEINTAISAVWRLFDMRSLRSRGDLTVGEHAFQNLFDIDS